jgi:hypothetical protein
MLSVLFRVLTVLGALWFAAGVAAGLLRPGGKGAPVPPPAPAPVALTTTPKADRLPIQYLGPRPNISVADASLVSLPDAREAVAKPRPKPVDRICGSNGRYWYTRDHHRFWRCRR